MAGRGTKLQQSIASISDCDKITSTCNDKYYRILNDLKVVAEKENS